MDVTNSVPMVAYGPIIANHPFGEEKPIKDLLTKKFLYTFSNGRQFVGTAKMLVPSKNSFGHNLIVGGQYKNSEEYGNYEDIELRGMIEGFNNTFTTRDGETVQRHKTLELKDVVDITPFNDDITDIMETH